jgi:hypothetical protein
MPSPVPALVGPRDRSLELQPVAYQFELQGGTACAPIDTEWDGNWLVVRVTAVDGQRQWSGTHPAFLTGSYSNLLGGCVPSLTVNAALLYSALGPNLQFEEWGTGVNPWIQARCGHEFAPPTGDPSIVFRPDVADVHRFAGALEATMHNFAIRVIEGDGQGQSLSDPNLPESSIDRAADPGLCTKLHPAGRLQVGRTSIGGNVA